MSLLKRKTRLKPKSDKRKAADTHYHLKVLEWQEDRIRLDGWLRCERCFEDGSRCMNTAMKPPHHRMGRGKYLSNKRFFMAACFDCHNYIEANKRWARKQRYILYK